MYKRLIIIACFFGLTLFSLNALANKFYWYVSIPSFDMFMHTLGGVFVSITATALLKKRGYSNVKNRDLLIIILLFVFIVGLGWEYYEYIVQFYIKGVQLAVLQDSISDLICDMAGGVIGFIFVILAKKRYNSK